MLDIKFVRDHTAAVEQALTSRGASVGLDGFLLLEKERRQLLQDTEALKSTRNTVSQTISQMKKAGQNADAQIAEMRAVGDRISVLDGRIRDVENELAAILLTIPNIPHSSVPIGADENDNPEVRRWDSPVNSILNRCLTGM